MKYKTFTWPNNPSNISISFEKRTIKHEYPEIDGAEFEELGLGAKTFTGNGIFFGKNAYNNFIKLQKVFSDKTTGKLYHPKYGTFNVKMTKLTSKEEPLSDYVEYDFEFIENKDIKVIEKKTSTKKPSNNSNDKVVLSHPYPGILKRGSKGNNVKLVQEVVNVKVDGDFGPKTEGAVKAWQKKHGLSPDGIVGPKTWNVMFGVEDDNDNNSKPVYYIIKPDDTLSKISLKFYHTKTKWKKIADANKKIISNPNVIKPGWKILIP
jgi:nucleoid-associated protein YgaU